MNLHSEIRRIASKRHIEPAKTAQLRGFSIAVRDLMKEAEEEGISPVQRAPAFCKSIQTDRFLRDHDVSIVRKEGPPSGSSTSVVVHYEFNHPPAIAQEVSPEETPEEWAHRLSEKLRGLLSDEIAAHGGAEKFMRWVRSADEAEAA